MHFEPLTKPYQLLVLSWLAKPHVAEFYYVDGLKITMRNIELYCDAKEPKIIDNTKQFH